MDINQANWQEVDASNNSAPPDGFPFGMAPSGENTGARAMMGAIKRWFNRGIPKTTAGTTTAYTLSYTVTPAAYVDGETYLVRFNAANGAVPTININALGAIPVYKYSAGAWAAVAAGDLTANMICRLSYNLAAGAFFVTSSSVTAIGAAFLSIANAFTATLSMTAAAINEASAGDLASAATVNIGAAAGNDLRITGTTTITAFDTVQAGTRRTVRFAAALTLTHNVATLVLPTAANIVTAVGDTAEFISLGAGNWYCARYNRASGAPLAGLPQIAVAYLGADVVGNDTTTFFGGPSITLPVAGTYDVFAWASYGATNGASFCIAKIWDGVSTVYASLAFGTSLVSSPAAITGVALGAQITVTGSTTIKMGIRNASVASGTQFFNLTGNSQDTGIKATRIG